MSRALVAVAACAAVVVAAGGTVGCKAEAAGDSPVEVSTMPEDTNTPQPPTPSPTPSETRSEEPSAEPANEPPSPTPSRTQRPSEVVVLGVGSEGRQVREVQARLQQLKVFDRNPTGYYGGVTAASVKRFQEQQGMPRTGTLTVATRDALRDRTDEPSKTELYPPTSRPLDDPDPRCLTGRVLCISKKSRTLAWMVDGEVRSAMDVRFGSAYTPTREGEFKVDFKSRDHHSTIYDTPMPYALFFSGGQAVHYSADFAASGYSGASHGCVNVRDKKKIKSVFQKAKKGDKVVVYK